MDNLSCKGKVHFGLFNVLFNVFHNRSLISILIDPVGKSKYGICDNESIFKPGI